MQKKYHYFIKFIFILVMKIENQTIKKEEGIAPFEHLFNF
jgi:hypothetical protein